ncbi:MAG: helix-turn-helix domain-containing protein [Actinomycetota bacterium]
MSSAAPTVHLDRAALAMLAHPLRSRLFAQLRVGGPATATTLAAALQTNTGATSYHLRKLERVGLVVDTGEGKGRQRLWSPGTEFRPRDADPGDDADADAAVAWLARDYLHHFTDRAELWLDTRTLWPPEWREPVGLSDHLVQVTAGQLSALRADLAEVLERYRRVGAGNPSAKRVSVYLCPLPVDSPRQ